MDLIETVKIKNYLEREFLTKPFNLVKSAGLLEGFQIETYVKSYEPINGIGIGYGGYKNAYYIEIMLKKKIKVNTSYLASYFGVSSESFRVKYVGEISIIRTTHRHRPAFPGVSIGHYNSTAGTFGCLVEDKEGRIQILSNNHILANLNSANLGDPILQPGPADGGHRHKDVIAELSAYIPIDFEGLNRVDAALAEPLNYSDVRPDIPHIGHVEGITSARLNIPVIKFGRTTGLTFGTITGRNATIKVNVEGNEVLFEDQIVIEGRRGRFSDEGDSGSLILDTNRQAIGLLFAGSATGVTFANPIDDVLTSLSVEII
jgi:hypothetical protein